MRQVHSLFIGVATLALVLALAATPAPADTGSVYYDSNFNVGAGHDFFNATSTGCCNVGLDYSVMPNLTIGEFNTSLGLGALQSDTNGISNVASGHDALFANTSGIRNLAAGYEALAHNDTGTNNVALGSRAGDNLTTGSNNVDIASPGVAGESGIIRIGTAGKQSATFLQGVYGKTVGGPTKAVVVNGSGRLGTAPAPAAPALRSQSKTLLRDRVRQLASEVHRLQKEVRAGG